jgi:hypothetical protein
VDPAGRSGVGELPGGVRDPVPDGHAAVIAGCSEFALAQGAFLERLLAVALEYQVRVAARQTSISNKK